MKEMNTDFTGASRSTRYRELKQMLEGRRRELSAEVQGKMRNVRATGEITKLSEVFDAVESSEADIQEDIELALIQMKSETLSKVDDALARLELLISRDFGQLSPSEIRRYIARVFDVVVFVGRLRSGRRCVQEIAELRDVGPDGRYELLSVFMSELSSGQHGINVDFGTAPDYRPGDRLIRKLALQGMRWMS